MSSNIAYDRTANVYTIESDSGELILAIGHTHALKLLQAEPFKLTKAQAQMAVTSAFAAIGATVSLSSVRKMASVEGLKRTASGSLSLEINLGNEAFSDDPSYELERIFKKIIQKGFEDQVIMDVNGNKVGNLTVDYEPPTSSETEE